MDDPNVPDEELHGALRYLRWVNRSLGGTSALIHHFIRWSARWPKGRPITMLDVGTGSGDIPLAVRAWGKKNGHDIRIVGVDSHAKTVEIARAHTAHEPGIEIVHADAVTLRDRFPAESFDYVHAGLFLHHLKEIQVLTVLAAMHRLAKAGVVWNDLVRSRMNRVILEIGMIGAPAIVKHDGRVSLAAGFTREEAINLAQRTDMSYLSWRRPFPWYRFTLAGETPHAWK